MKAKLVQHQLQMALQDPSSLASSVTDVQKKEMQERACSIIVLYLADNVLRHIDGEETTYEAWNKLEHNDMHSQLCSFRTLGSFKTSNIRWWQIFFVNYR